MLSSCFYNGGHFPKLTSFKSDFVTAMMKLKSLTTLQQPSSPEKKSHIKLWQDYSHCQANACSRFSYCTPDNSQAHTLYSLSPWRCLHYPGGLYIVCKILLYHFRLLHKSASSQHVCVLYLHWHVSELYIQFSPLRHRLLHHWTASTPASTAGNITGDKICTRLCSLYVFLP